MPWERSMYRETRQIHGRMKIFGLVRVFVVSVCLCGWCLALALPAGLAFGGQGGVTGDHLLAMDSAIDPTVAADEQQTAEYPQSNARRPEVGMPLAEALELLGKAPDSETEIGAACGMLDVLTWDEEGTRLISVDGTVTSIFESNKSESQ